MSVTMLFIVGCLVTLIVVGAMALLVYAAVLDGRPEREGRDEAPSEQPRLDGTDTETTNGRVHVTDGVLRPART